MIKCALCGKILDEVEDITLYQEYYLCNLCYIVMETMQVHHTTGYRMLLKKIAENNKGETKWIKKS